MEIELEIGKGMRNVVLPLAVGVIVGMAAIGRAVTPEGGGLLTPSAWQLRSTERVYAAELAGLRRQVEALADLMNQAPDAVRAGMAADRIEQLTRDGHPALSLQREIVAEAATEVMLWAMGGAERQQAEEALTRAIDVLGR